MVCLKCGRESDQTFCDECRAVMEKYPVRPDAILLLPKNSRSSARRVTPRKQTVPPEVQLQKAKRLVLYLGIALVCMVLIAAGLVAAMFQIISSRNTRPLGQNYSTVTKPTDETVNVPRETFPPVDEKEY